MKRGKPRNPSLDGLAGDLTNLGDMLSSGRLGAQDLARVRGRISTIEWYGTRRLPLIRAKAKQLGFASFWRKVDTETLAILAADYRTSDTPIVRMVVVKAVLSACAELEMSTPEEVRKIADLLSLCLSHSMLDEIDHRRSKVESKGGRAVREFLVETSERGKRLAKLGRLASWNLSLPGDATEGRSEARSVAHLAILEKLGDFLTYPRPLDNPRVLRATIEGELNSLLRKARDAVREMIRTELRRSSHYLFEVASQDTGQEDVTPLIEMVPDQNEGAESARSRLLLAQFFLQTGLTEEEQRVVLMVCLERRTQCESARILDMSQSKVSKTLKSARAKLQQVQAYL